jgi:type V secretory pathway adhesin AidA
VGPYTFKTLHRLEGRWTGEAHIIMPPPQRAHVPSSTASPQRPRTAAGAAAARSGAPGGNGGRSAGQGGRERAGSASEAGGHASVRVLGEPRICTVNRECAAAAAASPLHARVM